EKIYVRAGRSQTCHQRILKHVAGSSRILADDYPAFFFFIFAKIPSEETSYFVDMLYGQRYICFSTEAVSSKIFSHDSLLSLHFFLFLIILLFFVINSISKMRVFSTPIFVFLLFLSTFVTFHARISNRRYSCRSATIGSRFAALTAGKNPKMI